MSDTDKLTKFSELFKDSAARNNIPAAVIYILRSADEKLFSAHCGQINPYGILNDETCFDLASVTKLFTSSAFMRLVDMGKVCVDDPVCSLLPEFTGLRPIQAFPEPLEAGQFRDVSNGYTQPVDASKITFRMLLTHSSGLPAWLPLYLCKDMTEIRQTVLNTYFSYEPGSDVVYSDLSLILIGWAVEKAAGLTLDKAISELVLQPLALQSLHYRPTGGLELITQTLQECGIAPTDECHWRKRRLAGEVEDENAGALHGISGHAGLFGSAHDLARFGCAFLPGSDFLKPESLYLMTQTQIGSQDGTNNRALGFQTHSNDPLSYAYPFSSESFGHSGFTGTALWVDPMRDISIALLTNEVYNGRATRTIAEFRREIFAAIPPLLEED